MTDKTSKSPLMTPPATDRGLSEADLKRLPFDVGRILDYALKRGALGLPEVDCIASALLAAARREGEAAARDHDHSTEKATPESAAPDFLADLRSKAEAATPGVRVWTRDRRDNFTHLMTSGRGDYVISAQVELGDYGMSADPYNDVSDADAAFLEATTREAVLSILDEVTRLSTTQTAIRDHASDTGIALDWRPIESAPKDGQSVLLCAVHETHPYVELGYREGASWFIYNNGDYSEGGYGRNYETSDRPTDCGYLIPTHWMPLPPPPSSATPTAGQVPGMQNQ